MWQPQTVFIYLTPRSHVLNLIQTQDIRALTGTQDFVGGAPINFIYVSDYTRMDSDTSPEDR